MGHQKVQRGEEHYSRLGKLIAATNFQPQSTCLCKMKFHIKIIVEQQPEIFRNYYDIDGWTNKNLYLSSCVEKNTVTRKISDLNPINQQKERNYTFRYYLHDVAGDRLEVCNIFFL